MTENITYPHNKAVTKVGGIYGAPRQLMSLNFMCISKLHFFCKIRMRTPTAKYCECYKTSVKCLFQAIAKIREFILQKIYQFRKPMTNYQVPQNAMLKFRYIDLFIDLLLHILTSPFTK